MLPPNTWSKWLLSVCVRAIPAAWRQTGFPRLTRERGSCWRGQGSARLLLRSLTQWLGRGSEGASVGLIVRGQDGGSVMRCLCLVFSLPSSPRLYSALGECRRGCWRPHRSHGQIFFEWSNKLTPTFTSSGLIAFVLLEHQLSDFRRQ